ncbi:MAG: RnfABCDGE type electron transport complex subunit B [Pseudomonadota bacterium]
MSRKVTPEQIDKVLPQTQCGECGYNGCLPYAAALAHDNAAIDLCPPGGVKTLQAIARLVNENPQPYLADMAKKAKPKMLAVIREDECIGCTKCIDACPVDAILGSGKYMHTVIAAECTGCELCVAPCPVDCIDMLVVDDLPEADRVSQADNARMRFNAREQRLGNKSATLKKEHASSAVEPTVADKKVLIEAAVLRAKLKKQQQRGITSG